MKTEAQERAQKKYEGKAIAQKKMAFNRNTDADILEYLESDPEPFATKVKRLIREEMKARRK